MWKFVESRSKVFSKQFLTTVVVLQVSVVGSFLFTVDQRLAKMQITKFKKKSSDGKKC